MGNFTHGKIAGNTSLGCGLWEVKNSGSKNLYATDVKCFTIQQKMQNFIQKRCKIAVTIETLHKRSNFVESFNATYVSIMRSFHIKSSSHHFTS